MENGKNVIKSTEYAEEILSKCPLHTDLAVMNDILYVDFFNKDNKCIYSIEVDLQQNNEEIKHDIMYGIGEMIIECDWETNLIEKIKRGMKNGK